MMPKIVDHDKRRAEIAAAAFRAIDEKGLDRVRLVDVARLASCTTGAVSHYFPDKDAVLVAAFEYVVTNLVGQAPAEVSFGDDPVEGFIAAAAEFLPIDEPQRSVYRVWIAFCGRAVTTPSLAELHRDAYARMQASLAAALLEAGLATSDADAQQVAVSVMAIIDGLGLRAVLEPQEWPPRRLRWILALQLAPMLREKREVDSFEIHPHTEEQSA